MFGNSRTRSSQFLTRAACSFYALPVDEKCNNDFIGLFVSLVHFLNLVPIKLNVRTL